MRDSGICLDADHAFPYNLGTVRIAGDSRGEDEKGRRGFPQQGMRNVRDALAQRVDSTLLWRAGRSSKGGTVCLC